MNNNFVRILIILSILANVLAIIIGSRIIIIFGILLLMVLLVSTLIKNLTELSTNETTTTENRENVSEEKMAYIGTVAAGLAHEIRNPLNAIDFNIRMIQEDIEEGDLDIDDINERFSSTYKEIKHLERLVSDFLLYARKTVLQISKMDIKSFFKSIEALLIQFTENKDIKLSTKVNGKVPLFEADPEILKQAILNISRNGMEAMDSSGTLSLSAHYLIQNNQIQISISDTGKGINPRDLKKIFHLFYTTRRSGTGLGLPVAASIIENHQGRIEVDSKPGKGTTFNIFLPVKHIKNSNVIKYE